MTRFLSYAIAGATVAASQAWANGDHGPAIDHHPHMWGGGGGFGMIFVIRGDRRRDRPVGPLARSGVGAADGEIGARHP